MGCCLVQSWWCRFLPGDVFESNIAYCQCVAVLCMLYKIRCNLLHLLYDALPLPYVPVWVTCSALVAFSYTFVPSRNTAGLLFPCQYNCPMTLMTPYLMVWDWQLLTPFFLFLFSLPHI